MLGGDEITPTLDEPSLPEFRGATLSLDNELGIAAAANPLTKSGFTMNSSTSGKEIDPTRQQRRGSDANNKTSRLSHILFILYYYSWDLKVIVLLVNLIDFILHTEDSTSDVNNTGMDIAHGFFSSRNSMFQRAVDDSQSILSREENGTFIGSWLLTL